MSDAIQKTEKRCSGCRLSKPLTDFHKDNSRKDGCQRFCKPCTYVMAKAWQKANPKKVIISTRKCYAKNRIKRIAEAIEYRNNHLKQDSAKEALRKALSHGKLARPNKCSKCGKACKPDGHHWSYKKEHWLDVIWLCRSCHKQLHVDEKREKDKPAANSADSK